jgi:hypothetical protein
MGGMSVSRIFFICHRDTDTDKNLDRDMDTGTDTERDTEKDLSKIPWLQSTLLKQFSKITYLGQMDVENTLSG